MSTKLKSGKISSELTEPLHTPEPDRRVLIVADVHLGGFSRAVNREIEESFLKLLDYCRENCTGLIILGDLFDFWMEYPGSRPVLAEKVVQKLTKMAANGFPILYITGNHDNWMHSFFSECGIDVEHEYRIVTWNNRRVLLLHGDGLSDQSWGIPRPLLHRLLRNSNFVKMYQSVFPEPAGLWLMKWFSKLSSLKPSRKSRDKLDLWCRRILEEGHTDVVICGHHHYRRDEKLKHRRYLNTGNFFAERSLILYANKEFHPVKWSETSTKTEATLSLELNNTYEPGS